MSEKNSHLNLGRNRALENALWGAKGTGKRVCYITL